MIATWSDEQVIDQHIAPPVIKAASEAGRAAPRIAAVVAVAIVPSSQVENARQAAQQEFAIYEQTMPYQRVISASVSGRVSDICVIGDEEEVAQRLTGFREAGLTDFLAAPFSVNGANWQDTAERLSTLSF